MGLYIIQHIYNSQHQPFVRFGYICSNEVNKTIFMLMHVPI